VRAVFVPLTKSAVSIPNVTRRAPINAAIKSPQKGALSSRERAGPEGTG
jgi:hypothetical protein